MPFGLLFQIAHPPPTRAVSLSAGPACRRCPPNSGGQRRDSAAGSLDAPRFAPTLAALRASRPPSIGSSSLFCLVCFCLFVIVILCFIVPCGCWLRCYRRMALRLRIRNCIGFVPRLGVWVRTGIVPRRVAGIRATTPRPNNQKEMLRTTDSILRK